MYKCTILESFEDFLRFTHFTKSHTHTNQNKKSLCRSDKGFNKSSNKIKYINH